MTLLYIALAGALGSVSRYLVGEGIQRALNPRVPLGTFAVNVVGSFVIGLVMAVYIARGEMDSRLRIAVTVGFLGGFTTYSSFAYETVTLIEKHELPTAALYVAMTVVVAGLAAAAGIYTGRHFGP